MPGYVDLDIVQCVAPALAFSHCESLVDVSFPTWHPSCKC